MAGQVKHVKIFSDFMPDLTLLSVITRLKSKNTDALIARGRRRAAREGHRACSTRRRSCSRCWPAPGVLTRRAPDAREERRLRRSAIAWPTPIAGLDIGQTIVVKDRAVVAVEAMEGTDETIARAGQLAGAGTVVVKVAKPKQDMRFDVPVVGVADDCRRCAPPARRRSRSTPARRC